MNWVALFIAGAFAVQPPKIDKVEGFFYLNVGQDVQRALKSFDPYFSPWTDADFIPSVREIYKASVTQTMGAVVGDFNGDKKPDAAIMGRGRDYNLILAVLSKEGSYEVIEVERTAVTNPQQSWIEGPKGREKGLWRYLTIVKPGYISSRYEKKPITLKFEAFQDNYFEGGSVVFFYKDGAFHKYTTND